MQEPRRQEKKHDVLNYVAALISIALALCFLLFLLHMLSHLFWGVDNGIPFFVTGILRVLKLNYLESSTIIRFSSLLFLILGTLLFGYLSWLFAHRLGMYKNNHFQWKVISIVLIIILIVVGYFVVRFYR
ncbi:MAG: hypothetical protein WBE18_07155 [Gammaproteobacteria bacterium]